MTLLDDLIKADSPNLFWPMQETSGSTANDASGNGRNGTNSGCVVAQPGFGAQQYSYHIDAQGDYVTVAQDSGITLATDFTMGCWIKSTQASAGSGLVFFGQAGSASDYRSMVHMYSSDTYGLVDRSPRVNRIIQPTTTYATIFQDQWRFIAMSYQSSRYFRFYIDGVLMDYHDFGSAVGLAASTAPFRIGQGSPHLANSFGWTGYASHVFLNPSVLSDDRIAAYWRASKGENIAEPSASGGVDFYENSAVADPTCIAHYPLDETSGTTAAEVTGRGAGNASITASDVVYGGGGPSPALKRSMSFRTTSLVTMPATFDDLLTSTSMPQSWEIWADFYRPYSLSSTFLPIIGTQNTAFPLATGNVSGSFSELLTISSSSGNWTYWEKTGFIIPAGWHHYVTTFNGTTHSGWKMYLDGQNVEDLGFTKNILGAGSTGFASSLAYTYSLNGYNSTATGCALRAFSLYRRELSSADVRLRYQAGKSGRTGVVSF